MTDFFARKRIERDLEEGQPLVEHLRNTAGLAADFGRVFNSEQWGRFCGLLHDLGKYSREFQKRLCGGPKVDHSLAGALEALAALKTTDFECFRLIGQIISGHHTGLANGSVDEGGSSFMSRYNDRRKIPNYEAWTMEKGLAAITAPRIETLKFLNRHDEKSTAFALSFWGRMLFSALVDADFLDTEHFMSPEKFAQRANYPEFERLHERFKEFMAEKMALAPERQINVLRREVYEAALARALEKPGLFSLTVPTGGGKTLSSLAFAFGHAKAHGLRRVIYVIPFTSIIEQTAGVFRKLLGEELAVAVLEHHSNMLEPEGAAESEEADNQAHSHSLAIENWDAPIVVSTSVQFFESLFAARSSRCRKLHNITGSVIILDECQSLPTGLLQPSLAALKELAAAYGCSIVLCTATQPELGKKNWNPWGLEDVREIVPDAPGLFTVLKRVEIKHLGECDMEALTTRLENEARALVILDTKVQAAELALKLNKTGRPCFHLSTNMCPAHRREILGRVRNELDGGNRLTLVSTSLIEAGVDIDFPVVYRALSGLDSVAQAAGRCNREGRLPGLGTTYTFTLPVTLKGESQRRRAACQGVINQGLDLLSPEATALYFNQLYSLAAGGGGLDSENILSDIVQEARIFLFPYRTVARKFKFIEEDGRLPVLIPFNDAARADLERLRNGQGDRSLYRRLGQWTVNIRPKDFKTLRQAGGVAPMDRAGLWHELLNESLYNQLVGLRVDDPYFMEIEIGIQ